MGFGVTLSRIMIYMCMVGELVMGFGVTLSRIMIYIYIYVYGRGAYDGLWGYIVTYYDIYVYICVW